MASMTRYEQRFEPAAEHSARFTAFLRTLSPDDARRPVPGLDWTAGEVAAHVLSVFRRYTVDRRRAPTVAALAELNARDVADIVIDLALIADEIDEHLATLAAFAPQLDPHQEFEFHAGVRVTRNAAWANLIGELLVHGDDIARATGRAWTVPGRDLEGVWRALLPAAGGWLRAEARGIEERYELRFPFGAVTVELHDGAVEVDEPTGAPDHVITCGDAVSTTLAFPYRRRIVTDPTLALLATRFHDI